MFDKAETFVRIKPFNGASSDCRHDESYKYKVIKPLRRVKLSKFGKYKMKNRTRNYRRDIEMVSRG